MACDVCSHMDRKEIEASIFDGGPGNGIKDLANRFRVRSTHLLRHKEQHMVECSKEIVDMCNKAYDDKLKQTGVEKKLLSIEVLDAFIAKYINVLDEVTARDVLAAIKLKEDLLGNVTQKQEIKLSWLDTIPDIKENKDEQK